MSNPDQSCSAVLNNIVPEGSNSANTKGDFALDEAVVECEWLMITLLLILKISGSHAKRDQS